MMMMSEIEREPEYREPRNIARTRNHSASVKLEIPKPVAVAESPLKQNGKNDILSYFLFFFFLCVCNRDTQVQRVTLCLCVFLFRRVFGQTPAEGPRATASVGVRLGFGQLLGQRQGQQRIMGQLEQCGGRERPQQSTTE